MKFGWWRTFVACLLALALASPAVAEWTRAESANFILYSQGDEAKLRAQAALLEDYNFYIRALIRVTDPNASNKLNIYIVRTPAQLRALYRLPADAGGFYASSSAGIAAVIDESAPRQGQETLLHEVAHHFMWQYRPQPYPTWFIEGFAEYLSAAYFTKDTVEFGRGLGRTETLLQTRWLPLESVLFGEPPDDPDGGSRYYMQSWLLAHYLLRNEEQRPKLGAYLAKLARGENPRTAFVATFPAPLSELERDLRRYLSSGMTYSTFKRYSRTVPPPVAITRLPASADTLMLFRVMMEVGPLNEVTMLANVREAASRYHDVFAIRLLAQAEALHGDPTQAQAILDGLISANPSDAELHYLKGVSHLRKAGDAMNREAENELARTYLRRANQLNPNHWQTLLRCADALRTQYNSNPDETIDILLRAHKLAPQTQVGAVDAAQLLIRRKRWDEAERLLVSLPVNPHDQALIRTVQRLLRVARTRGGSQPIQQDASSGGGR